MEDCRGWQVYRASIGNQSERQADLAGTQVGGRRQSDVPQKVGHESRMARRAKEVRVLQGKGRSGCQGHSTLMLPMYYSAPSQGQLVQLAVLTR